MRKNSVKNTRINGEVLKELSNIIRSEIKDPRINPMTSVVAVEVAPDLKTCKAYISVLGDEKSQKDTITGLKSAEGYIRRQLARTVNLRNTPDSFLISQLSMVLICLSLLMKLQNMIIRCTLRLKTRQNKEVSHEYY